MEEIKMSNSDTKNNLPWFDCGDYDLCDNFSQLDNKTFKEKEENLEKYSISTSILLLNYKRTQKLPQLEISISVQPKPLVNEEHEESYLWYKCWKLPAISITLNLNEEIIESIFKYGKNISNYKFPHNIQCQIRCVLVQSGDNPNSVLLLNMGLKGTQKLDFISSFPEKQKVIFSNLYFSTTSYRNQGSPFHILVSIVIPDPVREGLQYTEILGNKISSPIYVDSRPIAKQSSGGHKDNKEIHSDNHSLEEIKENNNKYNKNILNFDCERNSSDVEVEEKPMEVSHTKENFQETLLLENKEGKDIINKHSKCKRCMTSEQFKYIFIQLETIYGALNQKKKKNYNINSKRKNLKRRKIEEE